jgi:hypothetical protein
MSLTRSAFLLRQDGFPARVSCLLDFLLFLLVCNESTLNGDFWCMVAVEEGSVDFNTSYLPACCA